MATPPRSAAERSLRPPSRRPIGVRAPATMTDGLSDMAGPPARPIGSRRDEYRRARDGEDPTLLRGLGLCNHAQHDLRHVRIVRRSPATSSPPSTTSASPCPTSTRRSRSTATPSACGCAPGGQRGAGRPRGDDGRRRLRLLHPAARAAERRVDDREVPRPLRPRHPAAGLPGHRPRRGHARRCASAACGCCTTSRAAAPSDSRVNFIHPKDAGGVLVELVEPVDRDDATEPSRLSRRDGRRTPIGLLTQ